MPRLFGSASLLALLPVAARFAAELRESGYTVTAMCAVALALLRH